MSRLLAARLLLPGVLFAWAARAVAHLAPTGTAPSDAAHLLGVEFASEPAALIDVAPLAFSGGWSAPSGAPAAVDSDGWPLCDAYAVFFDYAPAPLDPAQFVPPSVWGIYTVVFSGAGTIVLDPAGPGLAVLNSTLDEAAWETTAYIVLAPAGGANRIPGMALGVYNSVRVRGGAAGSGFSRLRLLQPGFSAADARGRLFTPAATAALAPFRQVRVHEWSGTNTVPCAYPCVVEWAQRRLATDALWAPGAGGKPLAVGAPWESALRLSAEAGGVSLWLNVPVYATGAEAGDEESYIARLAALLRDGNATLGIPGLACPTLFVEHGNELWLNTSSRNYMWNRAAAIAEVAAGGSVLNNDGSSDVEAWARRRHAKRLREIAAIFARAFANSSVALRPVFAWFQEYAADAADALAWLERTYGAGAARTAFAAFAVNAYRVPSFGHGSTPADVITGLFAASDAAVPARVAAAAVAAAYGLPLVSYEGSGWALPLGDGSAADNATQTAIILAQRSAGAAQQQAYDLLVNWAPLGGREYNLYALAGPYGPSDAACFGLTEDVNNLTAAKYAGVVAMQRNATAAREAAREAAACAARRQPAGCPLGDV